jgi:hypothetical protein
MSREPHTCFAREDTRIPLMAMPDAITALLALLDAPAASLGKAVYNVSAFSPRAGELADLVRRTFPGARIDFAPDRRRHLILDSWPADVDDTRARLDWAFLPDFDLDRAVNDYLVPNASLCARLIRRTVGSDRGEMSHDECRGDRAPPGGTRRDPRRRSLEGRAAPAFVPRAPSAAAPGSTSARSVGAQTRCRGA